MYASGLDVVSARYTDTASSSKLEGMLLSDSTRETWPRALSVGFANARFQVGSERLTRNIRTIGMLCRQRCGSEDCAVPQ